MLTQEGLLPFLFNLVCNDGVEENGKGCSNNQLIVLSSSFKSTPHAPHVVRDQGCINGRWDEPHLAETDTKQICYRHRQEDCEDSADIISVIVEEWEVVEGDQGGQGAHEPGGDVWKADHEGQNEKAHKAEDVYNVDILDCINHTFRVVLYICEEHANEEQALGDSHNGEQFGVLALLFRLEEKVRFWVLKSQIKGREHLRVFFYAVYLL